MSKPLPPCQECGMRVTLGEYHPFAACLMFKGCRNSVTVRENLQAITDTWHAMGKRAANQERRRILGPL